MLPTTLLRAAVFGAGLAVLSTAVAASGRPILLAQLSGGDLAVRINQLEDANRQLTGEIEELQHRLQLLSDRMNRLQASGGAGGNDAVRGGATTGPREAHGDDNSPRRSGRDQIGVLSGAAPAPSGNAGGGGPGAPMIIAPNLGDGGGAVDAGGGDGADAGGDRGRTGDAGPRDRTSDRGGGDAQHAAPPTNQPGDSYALAKGYLERRNYGDAELQFKDFLSSFPHDRLVGDALYGLGESYYMRKRYNDALEPFLKLVTDHPDASRAPDAMLRLGQTLNAINQKSQACATFNAIAKKFPRATTVKLKARHEMTADGC